MDSQDAPSTRRPRWRLRVFGVWMRWAFLGTCVFAPLYGVVFSLAVALQFGEWAEAGLGVVAGAFFGFLFGLLWVAVPAMVLAPITALLATSSHSDVDSDRYSLRVRMLVAAVLGLASLPVPVAVFVDDGLVLAWALLPVFVVLAALLAGHFPVMYTREVFDPATTDDPDIRRRIRLRKSERRYEAMRDTVADLMAAGLDDAEIAAVVTYETGLDYEAALSRIQSLRSRPDDG